MSADQQRQGAAAGRVRDDDADAAAVEVRAGQRSDDELVDRRVVEDLVGTADTFRAEHGVGHTCTIRV